MRRANLGETPSERAYINVSNLTRLRIALDVLTHVMASSDPLNIPPDEYQEVYQKVDGWIANLENRKKGH